MRLALRDRARGQPGKHKRGAMMRPKILRQVILRPRYSCLVVAAALIFVLGNAWTIDAQTKI
jgi:hypothetical protein